LLFSKWYQNFTENGLDDLRDRLAEEIEKQTLDVIHVAKTTSAKLANHPICVNVSCCDSAFDIEIAPAILEIGRATTITL
jgi:hypothetical protein